MSTGIQVILGNGVKVILGDEQVEGILLRNGRVIDCDTIIVATGIVPNIELAMDARIKVGRGIVVDDAMQTSDPSVYAVGECVEHRKRVYGLVAPGLEQAAVAAHSILMKGESHYIGSSTTSRLKVLDVEVFSAGKVGEEYSELSYKPFVYESVSNGIYRKLVVCHNRLVGAIVVGDWSELNRLQEMIDNQRRVWSWQIRRFMRTGMIWPEEEAVSVADWPVNAVVCNCIGVTRGTLGTAMSQGCSSLEAITQKTGASSVCGSCKPLLAELVGAEPVTEKQTGRKALAWSSLIALLAFFIFVLFPRLVPENSVQDPLYQISVLWRDGLWKQVSGFTLLGLSVLGLVVSMRKRLKFFSLGSFGLWRLIHTILGLTALLTLVVHTGFTFGENINAWLMANFLVITAVGSLAGFAVVFEDRRRGLVGRKIRRWSNQAHLWVTWPLPALLGFHILSVYYF
jgi:nitrite reductase (NADH) large subunit